ncbi:DUF302 domain-containing protein [Dyella sp. ASV21]|uniref:DUF302 domain-containing protein n=1 Tax=Dyella sp. ASV21 TaxID=2795114 RepID=UPI001E519746|nr:DUF302 domain-containing protein [Dyella sp. ASV21]
MSDMPMERGVVTLRSAYNVAHTVERLTQLLSEHGVRIFAHIDFSGDAAAAGLTLLPEQMLIFGNPRAGTPLMQVEPEVGLDLPLKVLVWEDDRGATWIAYTTADYVVSRHGLPRAMGTALEGALRLIEPLAR